MNKGEYQKTSKRKVPVEPFQPSSLSVEDGASVSVEPSKSQLRRVIEGTLFVAVWMVIGYALSLNADTYLLVGIPITIIFQIFVARKPLRGLWVRVAPSMKLESLKKGALAVSAVFALFNLIFLFFDVVSGNWEAALYELVAVLASVPLAYSLSYVSRKTAKPLLMCFATAGLIGAGTFLVEYWIRLNLVHTVASVTLENFLLVAVVSFTQYLPVVFLLEEVWFRGAFDSHVYHAGEQRPYATALYVSLLWGAWHFPTTYVPSDGLTVGLAILGELLAFQGATGFFLSLYWRKSGNLIVSGSVHAFIDSMRNGLG